MRKLSTNITAATLAIGLAAGIGVAGAAPAHASNSSSTAAWSNGVKITASAYLQTLSGAGGCGNYSSSAVVGAVPNWVKNVTNFHANGVGAGISGGSVSGSGADASVSWTNSNGTKGSYLSGNVCVNWLTWYLSMSTTGSALYYGNVRTATASI